MSNKSFNTYKGSRGKEINKSNKFSVINTKIWTILFVTDCPH